jgi:hypothetical protein
MLWRLELWLLFDAATGRGVPLTVLDVDDPAAHTFYARKQFLCVLIGM